ncbi:hypothetical protein CYMTET_3462 [Cymbomonas tetramitiformis]|uniref:Uncharacterized protein n=1 Tax=Cymbomonas tetramitiformis TaxID=36881 RepID=A0AAE0H3F4_9CHLO|nr:hypothetical protein CYMTET_3462 [Cymbomonas tetramitiformis]
MEDLKKINQLSTKAQAHLNAYTKCLQSIHRLSAKLLQQNIETTQLADTSTRKRGRALVDSDDEADACTLEPDPDRLPKPSTRVVRIDNEAVGLWLITAPLRTLSDVRDRSLCLVPGMAISVRVQEDDETFTNEHAVVRQILDENTLRVDWYVHDDADNEWSIAGDDLVEPECVQAYSEEHALFAKRGDDWTANSTRAFLDTRYWWTSDKSELRCPPHVSWGWNRRMRVGAPLSGLAKLFYEQLLQPALHRGLELTARSDNLDLFERHVVDMDLPVLWTEDAHATGTKCGMCNKCNLRTKFVAKLAGDNDAVELIVGRNCARVCACVSECVAHLRGHACSQCTVVRSSVVKDIVKHFRDMAVENSPECEAFFKQKLTCDKCGENSTAE